MTTIDPVIAADVLRSAAAWWRRAAEQLEAGDLAGAAISAKLAEFGTAGMAARIAEYAGDEE